MERGRIQNKWCEVLTNDLPYVLLKSKSKLNLNLSLYLPSSLFWYIFFTFSVFFLTTCHQISHLIIIFQLLSWSTSHKSLFNFKYLHSYCPHIYVCCATFKYWFENMDIMHHNIKINFRTWKMSQFLHWSGLKKNNKKTHPEVRVASTLSCTVNQNCQQSLSSWPAPHKTIPCKNKMG